MTRFFRAQFAANEAHWVLAEPPGEAPLDLSRCAPVASGYPARFVVFADGQRVDFNEASYCVLIVSDRLAALIREIAPGDVQFVPASVAGDDGAWWVVNVLTRIDCIDHRQSRIDYYPLGHSEHAGKPRGVRHLVLDADRIGDHHILRPRGWEVATIVSQTLKQAMEEAAITAAQLVCVTE